MNKFEHVNCNLCGQDDTTEIYTSKQYANRVIGEINITLVMCKHCDFIYQNPQLTSQILQKHYEYSSSGDVFRITEGVTRATTLLHERQAFIYDSLSTTNARNVGDIGGGTGLLLSSLSLPTSVKRYLIEPSDAIDKNNDPLVIKIKKKIENVDITEVKGLDFLMCISALEHLKDPVSILNSFHKLLSEGGYIFIEVPNSLKPYNTFAEYFSYEHVNHFTYETLQAFLNKSGFLPIKIDESKSVQTIRILAKKKSINQSHLINFFKRYQEEKNTFSKAVINKIKPFFDDEYIKNFCVYGAGDHTRFLIERFDCLNYIEYFIDSDPKKWGGEFYGKRVISPDEMVTLGIKDILISSHDFEKEIFTTIKKMNKDINVVTIYKDYK